MKKIRLLWWDILGLGRHSVFLTTDDTEYPEWKREMGVDLFPCVQRVPWSFDLRGSSGFGSSFTAMDLGRRSGMAMMAAMIPAVAK